MEHLSKSVWFMKYAEVPTHLDLYLLWASLRSHLGNKIEDLFDIFSSDVNNKIEGLLIRFSKVGICEGYESESEVTQSCPTLCDPMDCSLPVSSVHAIFQARILEWVTISFSRRSSQSRDRTCRQTIYRLSHQNKIKVQKTVSLNSEQAKISGNKCEVPCLD